LINGLTWRGVSQVAAKEKTVIPAASILPRNLSFSGTAIGMTINPQVAQALLPVRILQNSHRQECLCYSNIDRTIFPNVSILHKLPAILRFGRESN
jgi:hypothetical protein